MPALESLQVQYVVAFVVGLLGRLIELISGAMATFGNDLITQSADPLTMQALTTGIFGTNSGLIYWMNDKTFYMAEIMPYSELSFGLSCLLRGIFPFLPNL